VKSMQQQRGAVLIISMIILLLLTILGITSMRTTQLEERMAGNARDRHVAFEAAEAALIDAETYIQTVLIPNQYVLNNPPFDLNGGDGLYSDDPSLNNIETYVDWSGGDPSRGFLSATNIGTSQGVTTAPKYVIQQLAQGTQSAGGNVNPSTGGGYNDRTSQNTIATSTLVRITARGTGGSDNSVVFLQTIFGLKSF